MNNFPKVLIFRPGTAENSAVGRADKEIFDMTWAAKIDSTVESILAAPDLAKREAFLLWVPGHACTVPTDR